MKKLHPIEEDYERVSQMESVYLQEKEGEQALWWQEYQKTQEGCVEYEEIKIPEREQELLPF